jgi:uncharacterized protein with NRDE domain
MCLAVVALDAHPRYRVVIAANRDEFHARPAEPAHWWDNGMLAGRDLVGGGAWFGVSRAGRWALVTNFREGSPRDPKAPSRGELVTRAMQDTSPPLPCAARIAVDGERFHGFNLLIGEIAQGEALHRGRASEPTQGAASDAPTEETHAAPEERPVAAYASNRASGAISLPAGIYGLSNHLLDTPWAKVIRSKERLASALSGDTLDTAAAFALLADRELAQDSALPMTGVSRERERMLSSAFIVSPQYGTRCSTVYTLARDGGARMIERSFDPAGNMIGESAHAFTVQHSTH